MAPSSADLLSPDAPAVWEFVAAGDHRIPSAPVEQTVKTSLADFWRRLRPSVTDGVPSLTSESDIDALSDERLGSLAPPPSWDDAAAALDRALEVWVERPHGRSHAVLTLGHPHGGHTGVLRCWAEARGWRIVRAPDVSEVLGPHAEWFDELAGDGTPWVLPSLERCFIRHVNGLALVRALLSRVAAGALGRGVIGCDSWAWAFLQHQWGGQGLPTVVAQAFDADRLARWLAGLAAGPAAGRAVAFQERGTGRYLWPPPGADPVPTSDFVRLLSVHSRGIPGVAWATWRRSLVGTARTPAGDGDAPPRTVVLVRPWRELRDLAVPAGDVQETALVLHALLVHGGLPLKVLPLVLPLCDEEIDATVSRLVAADLVTCDGEDCAVTAIGYPTVRQFMAGRSVVTD